MTTRTTIHTARADAAAGALGSTSPPARRHVKLESARESAERMPARWNAVRGPALLRGADEISAQVLQASAGVIWARPTTAHLLNIAIQGASRHVQEEDNRIVHESAVRRDAIKILRAGVSARADIASTYRVLQIYIPHVYLFHRAQEIGWPGQADGLHVEDPLYGEDPCLAGLGGMLLGVLGQPSAADDLLADALLSTIAARVLQRWSNVRVRTPQFKGGLTRRQIRCIEDLVLSDLSVRRSLSELAASVGLSTYHFCRAFKVSTGQSPHQWVLGQRVAEARRLLQCTAAPVADIAARVGYDDPRPLSAAFRRATGLTPSEYRRTSCRA